MKAIHQIGSGAVIILYCAILGSMPGAQESRREELHVAFVEGAYGEEAVGAHRFRWLRSEAELSITLARTSPRCIQLELFAPQTTEAGQTVEITGPTGRDLNVRVGQATLEAPEIVRFELPEAVPSPFRLTLESQPIPAFPQDWRQISLGLRLPVTAVDRSMCRPPT